MAVSRTGGDEEEEHDGNPCAFKDQQAGGAEEQRVREVPGIPEGDLVAGGLGDEEDGEQQGGRKPPEGGVALESVEEGDGDGEDERDGSDEEAGELLRGDGLKGVALGAEVAVGVDLGGERSAAWSRGIMPMRPW